APERQAQSTTPCTRRRRSRRRRRARPRAAAQARPGAPPRATRASVLDPLPGFLEHAAEDPHELVELRFAGHERRRDLDHRIAAVVGTTDQAAFEQLRRKKVTQQTLRLAFREPLPRLLVLDELERVEATGAAEVARDGQLQELFELRAVHPLPRADAVDDPLALHDLDVLERDRCHHGVAADVMPWLNIASSARNGSITRAVVRTA